MAESDKKPVTLEELLVSSLAQTDALAKLLIEKGLIIREKFMQKISEERATYQKLLNPRRSTMTIKKIFSNGKVLVMNRAVGGEAAPKLCAILEALGVLEAATLECKQRNINTSEVKDALDLLELFTEPARLIPQFRNHLECDPNIEVDKEAQQQVLRATFPSIRHSIKEKLEMHMDSLAREFTATHDIKVKEKLEWRARNYRRVKEPWVFRLKSKTWP